MDELEVAPTTSCMTRARQSNMEVGRSKVTIISLMIVHSVVSSIRSNSPSLEEGGALAVPCSQELDLKGNVVNPGLVFAGLVMFGVYAGAIVSQKFSC